VEPTSFNSPTVLRMKVPSFKWRILVVDDEVGMAESLRMLLTHLGYEVVTAHDGRKAMDELRQSDYDMVITDLVMDSTSGYDILEFVNREHLNIPVIVLTGLGSVDAAVKALKQGAYDYILKPFQFDSFRSCVRRGIEKRQLEIIQRLQNQRMNAVASIAKAVTSTLKLDEMFEIIINQSREFVEFSSAALALVNEEEQFMDLLSVLLETQSNSQNRQRIFATHPFFADSFDKGGPVVVADVGENASGNGEVADSTLSFLNGVRSYVLAPLLTKDRIVGAVFFGSQNRGAYNHQEVKLLSLIADQIAVAVDNARLLDLEQRRSQLLEIVNSIGKRLTSALVVEKLLETAVVLLKDHFQYKYVDIYHFDESRASLVRTQCTGADERAVSISPGEGIVGRVAITGETILLNNVHAEPAYIQDREDASVELAVPLKSEGKVFGVLNIEDTASHKFTDSERTFVEAVASQISLAWRNAKLFEQIRKSKVYLELVLNAADDTSIISVDRDCNIITFNSGSETLLGLKAEEAIGQHVGEIIVSRRTRAIFGSLGKNLTRDCWEEEVRVSTPRKRPFWARIVIRPIEPAVDLFVGFLIILTNVTQRVQLERKLKQLTVTDDLTGLFNQRHFFEQLRREMERVKRRHTRFSLCIFDLDKFKRYNDSQGHLAGDHLLKAVGKLVAKEIRKRIDTAFRYGGDEFVLILPDTSLQQAASLVNRLRAAIHHELENVVGISAGIAEYVEGLGEKEFIEAADQLMYEAKRQGGDRVVYRLARSSQP
jgi:diguanylate cyclase (GGDEF)-like protein/PAS domain S-box-containing protein